MWNIVVKQIFITTKKKKKRKTIMKFELIQLIFMFIFDSSRYFHWNMGLYFLLFMVIALIPFYIAYFCISNIRFGKILKINAYK